MKRFLTLAKLIPIMVLLLVVGMKAQGLKDYSFRVTNETWIPLGNGEGVNVQPTNNQGTSNNDEGETDAISIGFDFPFDGKIINSIRVNTDGYVRLGEDHNTPAYNEPMASDNFKNNLNPLRFDATVGSIATKLDGKPGSRVFTIEWRDYQYTGTNTLGYIQVKLYENGTIKYIYGPGVNKLTRPGTSTSFWHIFLCGDNNIDDFIGVDLGVKESDKIELVRNQNGYAGKDQYKQISKLTSGTTVTFIPRPLAGNVVPNDNIIYIKGDDYDTPETRPSLSFEGIVSGKPITFTYKIVSKDEKHEIYTALDINGNTSIEVTEDNPKYIITNAKGDATTTNGIFSLKSDKIKAGEYKVIVTVTTPHILVDGKAKVDVLTSPFYIARSNDIAVGEIVNPKLSEISKYQTGMRIPVSLKLRNVGMKDITKFAATAEISYKDPKTNELVQVYTDTKTVEVNATDPKFSTNTMKLVTFQDFLPKNGVGLYTLVVKTDLIEPAGDEDLSNNTYPMVGSEPHYFEVAENVDLLVDRIIEPSHSKSIGRPITPVVRVQNFGVTDLAEVAEVSVKILDAQEQIVFETVKAIETVPAFPKGTFTDVNMDDHVILNNVGTYTVIAEVVSKEDKNAENNIKTQKFTVETGLEGVYTIGSDAKAIDVARNFENFDKALAAMHLKSITGPVTFLLTEKVYNINRTGAFAPALDFSSKIVGVNEKNTITFKAAPAIDTLQNEKVVITMNTESGIGVLFGQSTMSTVANAPVNSVYAKYKNSFAKSEGYITFDGGKHKSLEFNLVSNNSTFRSAFYLAQGASNITVKNIVISDNSVTPIASTIPATRYNGGVNVFEFDRDANYTAGVLLRSVTPYDKARYVKTSEMLNTIRLDTLQNANNIIDGNEIYGFGLGVASMGIGVLKRDIVNMVPNADGELKPVTSSTIAEYMNHDNKIVNNTIFGSSLAGVFFGFENNSIIKSNQISDQKSNEATYAILLGNQLKESNQIGYFNQNIKVLANRIFRIESKKEANGVASVQNQNTYIIVGKKYVYPKGLNKNIIASNAITNINGTADVANLYGISVLTGREVNKKSPAHEGFRTKGDVIANNTIFFTNSNVVTEDGEVANIRLMQTSETKVINNLMYMSLGNGASTNGKSLVNLTSKMPTEENILIDRNVYFFDNANSNTDLVRYYQTNEHDAVYNETGFYGEFSNLEQWQTWAKMDINSFVYDFSNEIRIEADGTPEVIKVAGKYPLNSKLNNTGYTYREIDFSDETLLSDIYLGRDINDELRGQADSRYDIGANEFFGEVYVRDFEVLKIISPNSYKPTASSKEPGVYQVMTKAPVNVTALIRNNGNMPAKRVKVIATIYREFSTGQWDSTYTQKISIGGGKTNDTLITVYHKNTYETYVDIDQYGHAIANFDIGNTDKTPVFVPKTYHEFKKYYTVPAMYKEMATTITPQYKIVVEVIDELDQLTTNNKVEKTYRFFVKKSNIDLLVSAENAGIDIINSISGQNILDQKEIAAGGLNYDSLKLAMNRMGLYQVMGDENPFYYFDVIDRNVWDARAYDYSVYNTLFWIDGHDKAITIFEANDLKEFLDNKHQADNWNYKKSLVIASQEFLRANTDKNEFLKNYISATRVGDGNPLGNDVDYSGNFLDGDAIAKDLTITIKSTGFQKLNGSTVEFEDDNSKPATMTLHTDGLGITSAATNYRKADGGVIANKIAGSTTYGLTRNMIYLGQDWRHFGNGDILLRGIFDYLNRHGSTLTPVELVDFEAIDRNKNVELSWATASELNSSHFEIEKAMVGENGKTSFQVIATEQAAGKSNVTKSYGPIVDKDVNYGATYVYRLRSVDQDGSSSLSNEVEVSIDNFFGVSPNPASSNVVYSYSIGEAQNAQIEIYDVTGKMVKSLFNGVAKANDSIQFNVSELANGSYTIVLKTATNTYTTKLSVRK